MWKILLLVRVCSLTSMSYWEGSPPRISILGSTSPMKRRFCALIGVAVLVCKKGFCSSGMVLISSKAEVPRVEGLKWSTCLKGLKTTIMKRE